MKARKINKRLTWNWVERSDGLIYKYKLNEVFIFFGGGRRVFSWNKSLSYSIDRDINAANNILRRGLASLAQA